MGHFDINDKPLYFENKKLTNGVSSAFWRRMKATE